MCLSAAPEYHLGSSIDFKRVSEASLSDFGLKLHSNISPGWFWSFSQKTATQAGQGFSPLCS